MAIVPMARGLLAPLYRSARQIGHEQFGKSFLPICAAYHAVDRAPAGHVKTQGVVGFQIIIGEIHAGRYPQPHAPQSQTSHLHSMHSTSILLSSALLQL